MAVAVAAIAEPVPLEPASDEPWTAASVDIAPAAALGAPRRASLGGGRRPLSAAARTGEGGAADGPCRTIGAWREAWRQLALQAWAAETSSRREMQNTRLLTKEELEDVQASIRELEAGFQGWTAELWHGLAHVRKRVRVLGANIQFAPVKGDVLKMVQSAEHDFALYAEQVRQQYEELTLLEGTLQDSLEAAALRFDGWCAQESAAAPSQRHRAAVAAAARRPSCPRAGRASSASAAKAATSTTQPKLASDEVTEEERQQQRARAEERAKREQQVQLVRREQVAQWRKSREQEQREQAELERRRCEEAKDREVQARRRLAEQCRKALEAAGIRRAAEAEESSLLHGPPLIGAPWSGSVPRALSHEDKRRIAQRSASLLERKAAQQEAKKLEAPSFEPPGRGVAFRDVEPRLWTHTQAYVDQKHRELQEETEALAAAPHSKYNTVPGNFAAQQGVVRTLRCSPLWRKQT